MSLMSHIKHERPDVLGKFSEQSFGRRLLHIASTTKVSTLECVNSPNDFMYTHKADKLVSHVC